MKIRSYLFFIFILISTALTAEQRVEKVTILGSGPAGLTAAIYTAQANLTPLVVEGEECEGQLQSVFLMENYPGFPEGIAGDELIERMRAQAKQFGAQIIEGRVIEVDLSSSPFVLYLTEGQIVYTEALIIASGTSKRWLEIPSEHALKGKGVSSSATCEAPLFMDKEVVVLGGSDAALEEALVLSQYAKKVTLVHRGEKLNASSYLKEKVASNKKIHLLYNQSVEEILDVAADRVTGIVLRDLKTDERSSLPCEGIFVSIGRKTNTDLFKGQLEITPQGSLQVIPNSTQTSVNGVFAAGDVMDLTYRKAITAASFGCMAALDAIRFLNTSPIKN